MAGAGIGLQGLRTFQFGKESTRGTAVAATSKMAVEDVQFEPIDTVSRPKLAKGVLLRNPGNELVVTRGTRIVIPDTALIYDQIQNFLSSLRGAVTPTGTNPYTWAFTPLLTADPAPDAWTIERRLSDGTDNIDNEWAYCLWSVLKFTYQIDQPLTFSAEGFGRRVQASTLTAALSLPAVEIPPTALCQAWIDSTWAALGTTQIAGQVLKAEVTINTGLKPKLAFDGRTDLDFTTYVFDPTMRGIDVALTVMVKTSAGQYATEKTAAEALTKRALRLKVLGTSSREFTLDMLLTHEKGSLFTIGSEDGQDIVEMKLVDANDGTNWLTAKVVNAVAAYT